MPRTNVAGTTAPSGSGAQRCAQAGEREHRTDSTARPAIATATGATAHKAKHKTRAGVLAEQLLRDRAEHAARKAVRTGAAAAKTERGEFDPFTVTRWRVVAGGNPGHLVQTPMRRGPVGWFIACRGCALEFESKGWAYCPDCMALPAEERRDQPKPSGRNCERPGCDQRLSRHARADALYCSSACRKAASRDKTAPGPTDTRPPEMSQLEGSETRIKRALLIGPKHFPINIVGGQRLPQEKPNPLGRPWL